MARYQQELSLWNQNGLIRFDKFTQTGFFPVTFLKFELLNNQDHSFSAKEYVENDGTDNKITKYFDTFLLNINQFRAYPS